MPDASREHQPVQTQTPMRRLWSRYLRARGAKLSLVMITVFILVAFLAPFLANRLPFYWRDAATGAVSYPLIRDFFAPADTTEPVLEKGLNFLLLFIPLALAVWKLINVFLPRLAGMESKTVSLLFGALLSFALWYSIGGMISDAGGNDWLYAETHILPETDDVVDPSLIAAPLPAKFQNRQAARAAVDTYFASRPGILEEIENNPDPAKQRENLAALLRDAILSPALASVAALRSQTNIDPRGITDANLSYGLNQERWNRIIVDYAYPGLLRPFVEFRTAFLILAVVAVLVLLGMTFIFMTAANQFTASPRWLILLALAALLSLPFGGTAKNDYTPYRQLAALGLGRGIFPPIPYGPNEQGFGPRLPPDWAMASPRLGDDDILDLSAIDAAIDRSGNPAVARVAALLAGNPVDLASLNKLIADPDLYQKDAFASLKRDLYLQPFLQGAQSAAGLSPIDKERLNRLLLERTFPNTIRPALAGRWKKPQNLPGRHLLGTDESGRDVLTRLIHGARVSLSVGFVSVALATAIGLVLGSLAAYYGAGVDIIISRFMELMMCFPSTFLILAVIAVLDKRSILNIMLIIGLTSWTGVARLIRGEMLKHKKMDYVKASIALGATDARTIFRHILPNAMAPVLVSVSFGITGAILTEASLSFIGFGVTPPTPTWGQLLSETRESPLANWWLAVFPGLVLFLGVLSYNLVGEALRDALDPRTTL